MKRIIKLLLTHFVFLTSIMFSRGVDAKNIDNQSFIDKEKSNLIIKSADQLYWEKNRVLNNLNPLSHYSHYSHYSHSSHYSHYSHSSHYSGW